MKLKSYLAAIMLFTLPFISAANDNQTTNCWWIFCEAVPENPVPMGPGGGGHPPGPDPDLNFSVD